ncbi:MAG: serine hydrolase [Pseudomonadota bacterium]
MRAAIRLAVALFIALNIFGFFYGREAVAVATGYSAKQLCSGVFVSRLPEDFIIERDILPRMAVMGPALPLLELTVNESEGFASAALLGMESRATHSTEFGCVLHGEMNGQAAQPDAEPADAVGVPAVLETAFAEAFSEPADGQRSTMALLVMYNGELLAERYSEPVAVSTRLQGWSMNKSLMATWIGLATEAGEFDPTQPVIEQLTSVDDAPDVDSHLTTLHLLQMESGLDFDEFYAPGSDATSMLYRENAMWRRVASTGQRYAPGLHFSYSSGDSVFASFLWQHSLTTGYSDWIRTRFSNPLGITSLVAEADASGVQVGSSYAYMTARDWLRVGQLWLDAWHGRSDLLSQEWLRASVAARESSPSGRYGRGFWLNTGRRYYPAAPATTFLASGNAGQVVVVIPEWEMVVVRLGLTEPRVRTGVGELIESLNGLRSSL